MKSKKSKPTRASRQIKEAVKRLLAKKKDINAITVMDISKEANVNRGTFYNHYDNINDIINEIEEDLMNEFVESWRRAEKSDAFADSLMTSVTSSIRKHEQEYSEIIKYIPQYTFTDLKSRILKEITSNYLKKNPVDQETKAGLFILANGIAACYIDYFQKKLNVDLDELSKTSARLIKRIL